MESDKISPCNEDTNLRPKKLFHKWNLKNTYNKSN